MANTGYGAYRILEEYDTSTNQPTGKEKFNVLGDTDYVAPFLSDKCPIPLSEVLTMSAVVDNNYSSDPEIDSYKIIVTATLNSILTQSITVNGQMSYFINGSETFGGFFSIFIPSGIKSGNTNNDNYTVDFNRNDGRYITKVVTYDTTVNPNPVGSVSITVNELV